MVSTLLSGEKSVRLEVDKGKFEDVDVEKLFKKFMKLISM